MIDPTDLSVSLSPGEAHTLLVFIVHLIEDARRRGDGRVLLQGYSIHKRVALALDNYQRPAAPPIAQVLGDIVPQLLEALPKRKKKKG